MHAESGAGGHSGLSAPPAFATGYGVPSITQRGNNRQDVFFVDDDRRRYLELLGEASERFGLKVAGYCLMTNHLHLVATPSAAQTGQAAFAAVAACWPMT